MEKFLLIIREDLKKLRQYTEEQHMSELLEMQEWTDWIIASGNYIDSNPLKSSGRYISKDSVISDGPFIESKEGVSGYYLIQASSMEHAIEITQRCPLLKKGLAVVEVRPVEISPA
jgi:hypothetical protein